jgi:cytochrome P450
MSDFFGDGIFAVDGDKWQQQRKIASFEFSTKVLRSYTSGAFRTTATKLAQTVSELASSNQKFDIQVNFCLQFYNY